MKNYLYITAFISFSITTISCGDDSQKKALDSSQAISVTVSSHQEQTNNPYLNTSGKIQAVNSADLSTRMMGFVNKVHVKVGDKVEKGQLLVSINNTELQAKQAQVNASITEATAAYVNAKKDFERFQNLFAENSASQKEVDDISARYEMAKARLEGAKQMKNEINAQFAYSNITAPFNGIITSKTVEEGNMANPGVPLISIEAPGNFEVMTMVPETDISKIKNGSKVTVTAKSLNKTITGNVSEVSTSARNTGGQYLVKVALEKTEAPILSGMFVNVQFPVEKGTSTVSKTMYVPESALVKQGQLTGVYTIGNGNVAILRWLRIGKTFGDQVEILSGLSKDEPYIITSEGKLYNGAKVLVK
ncbi:MAG: efflux RND transporter periplasmic adaptor subunit [Flavobacteriaceae bacterium]